MTRCIAMSLMALSLLSTGCAATVRYSYRDDYRYRYSDRDHNLYRDSYRR